MGDRTHKCPGRAPNGDFPRRSPLTNCPKHTGRPPGRNTLHSISLEIDLSRTRAANTSKTMVYASRLPGFTPQCIFSTSVTQYVRSGLCTSFSPFDALRKTNRSPSTSGINA